MMKGLHNMDLKYLQDLYSEYTKAKKDSTPIPEPTPDETKKSTQESMRKAFKTPEGYADGTDGEGIPPEDSSSDEELPLDDSAVQEEATPGDSQNQFLQNLLAKLKPEAKAALSIPEQLDKAQSERRSAQNAAQAGMWGNLIGASIAGHGAQPVPLEYFKSQAASGELPMKEFAEKLAIQKSDSKSPVSKVYQDYLTTNLGFKPEVVGNVSATDLEKFMPQATRQIVIEKQADIKKAIEEQKYKQKVGEEAASTGAGELGVRAQAIGEQARETEAEKQKGRKEIQGMKASQKFTDLGAKTDRDIDSKVLGARNALGMASRTIVFADKIPALLNQYKDLNQAPPTIVSDVNQAFANLISQGVPGQHMLEKLDGANVPRNAAGLWQYLTASPTGAGQKELMNLISDSAKIQQNLARAQIKDYVIPTVKIRENAGLTPQDRSALLNKYGVTDEEYSQWKGPGQLTREATGEKPQSSELKRLDPKTGKTAIFDANTKKFIRYEQ